MKEKIRNCLLTIGIGYMVVIVLLMFNSYANSSKYIMISTTDEYDAKLAEYKSKANNITEESCKNYYLSFIDYIEKDKINGKIEVSEYFKRVFSEEPFLSFYSKGIEACSKLTQEAARENSFPLLFLGASIQQDAIMGAYTTQYELTYPDRLVRMIAEPSIGTVQANIKYGKEVEIIERIYNIVTEEEVVR